MLSIQNCRSIATLCTLLACSVLFGTKLPAQETTIDRNQSAWHFGYDLLQMLLEERGLRVVDEVDEAFFAAKSSVIVITGSPPALSSNDWGRLVGFVLDGGTLLLALDNSFTLPGIGRFSKGPVTTLNPSDQYQGFVDCLRVFPNPETQGFSGVSEIVTNRPGWFVPDTVGWLEWDVLASLPIDSRPVGSRKSAVLAVGRWGAKDAGLAIVSADAGLFSNGMLWHGDNAIAAIRMSELLCRGGTKTQLVFLADGQAMDSYRNRIDMTPAAEESADNRPEPEPELRKALRLANAIAKEVAESNVLNEALRQRPRGIQPSRYFRAFLYFVAVLILLLIIWLLLASGALQAVFLAPRKMRSAYEMREHASGLADDFRNSAGYLARDFCWELTGSKQTADWQKLLAELLSNVRLPNGSLPNGSQLSKLEQQELVRIIDIACRGCHARMTSHEFQLLGKSISILRGKHRTQPPVAVGCS